MNYLLTALAWIADPAHWPGANGIGTLTLASGGTARLSDALDSHAWRQQA